MEFDKSWERRGKCVWYDGFLFVFCKLVSVIWKVTGFYEYKNTGFYEYKILDFTSTKKTILSSNLRILNNEQSKIKIKHKSKRI